MGMRGQKGHDARSNAKAARRVIAARGPSRPRGCSSEWSDSEIRSTGALLRARSNKADHERGTLKAGERRRAWAIELQPSIADLACGRAKEREHRRRLRSAAAERGCGAWSRCARMRRGSDLPLERGILRLSPQRNANLHNRPCLRSPEPETERVEIYSRILYAIIRGASIIVRVDKLSPLSLRRI